jgi:hypothetical protein
MIAAVRQRIADFFRERRIANLRRKAQDAPHASLRRVLVDAMCNEINARSPGQVARMERARGLA